jgi:thymidylate synthase
VIRVTDDRRPFNPSVPSFDCVDAAQQWALGVILTFGQSVSPRGMNTLEVIGGAFSIRNPRRRCTLNTARMWSLPLAIGELCWHLSASDDLSFIAHYAPRWREFSDDGSKVIGSCYGKRVFGHSGKEPSQWQKLIQVLRDDPMTRRALLVLHEPDGSGLDADAKDVACATVMQFFIRHNELHAITYMRSNDVIWGLPYDVFLFTMIQELLAETIQVKLGEYHHIPGSLHLYERHFSLAERILRSSESSDFEMPAMACIEEIPRFLASERELRISNVRPRKNLSCFWMELLDAIYLNNNYRNMDEMSFHTQYTRSYYRDALRPLSIHRENSTASPLPSS